MVSRCIGQCPGRKQISHSNEAIEGTLIKGMFSMEAIRLRTHSGHGAP